MRSLLQDCRFALRQLRNSSAETRPSHHALLLYGISLSLCGIGVSATLLPAAALLLSISFKL